MGPLDTDMGMVPPPDGTPTSDNATTTRVMLAAAKSYLAVTQLAAKRVKDRRKADNAASTRGRAAVGVDPSVWEVLAWPVTRAGISVSVRSAGGNGSSVSAWINGVNTAIKTPAQVSHSLHWWEIAGVIEGRRG